MMRPLLLSFAVLCSVLAAAQKGPMIQVDKDVHDYGTIAQGANGECALVVTNIGDAPLIITNCKGSCGCTVPCVRGTTSVNEDVAFPVQHLADAVTDLRQLFDDFGYTEGVIFGHAKDGNLHFLVNQAFDTPEEIQFFDKFLREMVSIVSGKSDGSLKAEHGPGRNMAPFVETEWGSEAYAIMRDLKSLLDPDGMLNPGVLINEDPQAHVTHLKSLTLVAPEIDKCIECGFCESKCPSRRLTLTPRQRIVIQRELASMRLSGSSSAELDSVSDDYSYAGIETCALDGLNTIVKIYNSDGIYGVGECCPYRSIHGETQTGTVAFAKDLAAALLGSDPREIHKHVAWMDRMIVGNASVKCAFDMALYDLVAKMDELPLYAFLRGDREKNIYKTILSAC